MNHFPKELAQRGPGFVWIIGSSKWQTTVRPLTSIPGWTQRFHWLTSTPLGSWQELRGNCSSPEPFGKQSWITMYQGNCATHCQLILLQEPYKEEPLWSNEKLQPNTRLFSKRAIYPQRGSRKTHMAPLRAACCLPGTASSIFTFL